MPSFDRIRYRRQDSSAFLYAFDLIELNGADLRRAPLEVRKATLANVLAGASQGIWSNDHIEGDGPIVFKHPASWGSKAWSRSGRARLTAAAACAVGSR